MTGRYRAVSKYAVAIIVVVIIIVAIIAAVYMMPKEEAATPTTTSPTTTPTTPPKAIELTGDFEKDVVEVGKALEANGISEVKYSVWGAGDPNSVMRVYGIVEVAERINKIWEENGVNVRITITDKKYDADFKAQYEEYLSKQPLGQAGDFFVNSYVFISVLAKEGYILDITDYANKYSSLLEDFYSTLLDAMKYKGRMYGLPQDTEARPLYIRKDVAGCTGLDLSNLDEKVKNGEFTWSDVYNWAKQAKDKGCAEWGLVHRKGSAHPDLVQFIYAFGGELYDPDEDKVVIDKEAIYKWLYVEWKFARDGLLPEDIMAWDWAKQIHPTIVSGNTLFDIGGTWYWTEWQTKEYYTDPETNETRGLKPEEVKEWFYYTLFPAGESGKQPVTLSQPFAWMINSKAGQQNPKYDDLKELYHELAFLVIVKASDPDINAIHSIISSHLPVRKAAANLLKNSTWLDKLKNLEIDLCDEVKDAIKDIVEATVHSINAEFLANVGYMLEYTKFAPSHPVYPKVAEFFAEAVDKVLRGEMDPEQAVNYIIDKVNADPEIKAEVKIVGEIPSGWSFP